MEPIAKVLPTVPRDLQTKATSVTAETASSREPIRQSALRRFWARMAAIYGHRWASAYGDSPEDAGGSLTVPGDTWNRGLVGVTEKQVAEGLNRCIASADPWPPSLPEFRSLCLSVPSIGSLRAEQRAGGQPSPFMRLLWQNLDTYRMRHADADKADRMFKDAYDAAREHVMRGGALPEPPAAALTQAAPEPFKPAAPEVVEAAKKALDAILGEGE